MPQTRCLPHPRINFEPDFESGSTGYASLSAPFISEAFHIWSTRRSSC
jgi:hypothetical protein